MKYTVSIVTDCMRGSVSMQSIKFGEHSDLVGTGFTLAGLTAQMPGWLEQLRSYRDPGRANARIVIEPSRGS